MIVYATGQHLLSNVHLPIQLTLKRAQVLLCSRTAVRRSANTAHVRFKKKNTAHVADGDGQHSLVGNINMHNLFSTTQVPRAHHMRVLLWRQCRRYRGMHP
jgi:hypothetical protein